MSYARFCKKVKALVSDAGGFPVIFRHEDGKHIAWSDDITIIGNTVSPRVTIRWGSGHIATASI